MKRLKRQKRQKTSLPPVDVWSDFCESMGTRCTYVYEWSGNRCEQGVTKGTRCATHQPDRLARVHGKTRKRG